MKLYEQVHSIGCVIGVEPKTMETIYCFAQKGGLFGSNRPRGSAASLLNKDEILTLLRCVVISFLVNSRTQYIKKFNQNPSARYFVERDDDGRAVALVGERLNGIRHHVIIDGAALQCALDLAAKEVESA